MKKDRLSLFCGIALVILAGYWISYFATVGTAAPTTYVVFSRFTAPGYRVPSSMQVVAHRMFEPAFFADSRFLRSAKWDALRPPAVLQPVAGSQNR